MPLIISTILSCTTETSAESGASKDEEIKETDLKDELNAGDKAEVPASSDEKTTAKKEEKLE